MYISIISYVRVYILYIHIHYIIQVYILVIISRTHREIFSEFVNPNQVWICFSLFQDLAPIGIPIGAISVGK